ncbi:MAG TPA: thymidylate synthase [Actinobacteria bacterium]|nr:FAD-dependent thymidylate synthase [bacterium BMS3Bbin02]HDL42345.1 thymidylate synthase [Actinomycetota bacterium]
MLDFSGETFTDDEAVILGQYFTNLDSPVFGLINLPEVVKGALFARYSRSPKSVRRLFLDEFYTQPELGVDHVADHIGGQGARAKAEGLYQRVFSEYGDDSVAQLGGAHLACEQASNVLTKILERGRLASYLEQSTRYIFYDERLGDRYRYMTPPEVAQGDLADTYVETMEWLFRTYTDVVARLVAYYETLYPKSPDDSNFVWKSTIRAKACDDARGLLPASSLSNVGIFASGQAYEALLMRMRAHPLAEARAYSDLMLMELRKMIPAFMKRVDVPDRGGAWSAYFAAIASDLDQRAEALPAATERPEVTLVEFDPDAETKIAAAVLYRYASLPDDQILDHVRGLATDDRAALFAAGVGNRTNRRHKPGRGFERADYRFDILCDYGIFRDLQRHRMLSLDWQRLTTHHGFVTPESIADVGASELWAQAMERTDHLYESVVTAHGKDAAQYVVPFAYKIRFFLQMNAREAFHLLELRTGPGGHPDYRRVCQKMHTLIRDEAGHSLVADAMEFVDYNDYALARLEGERRADARRAAAGIAAPASE